MCRRYLPDVVGSNNGQEWFVVINLGSEPNEVVLTLAEAYTHERVTRLYGRSSRSPAKKC
jgi:hypothetical protein